MNEATDNELDEPREELLSAARDGTDAVINYVGSSTNQKLQAYYKHLRTVREILINPFPVPFKSLVPGQKSRVFSRDI